MELRFRYQPSSPVAPSLYARDRSHGADNKTGFVVPEVTPNSRPTADAAVPAASQEAASTFPPHSSPRAGL